MHNRSYSKILPEAKVGNEYGEIYLTYRMLDIQSIKILVKLHNWTCHMLHSLIQIQALKQYNTSINNLFIFKKLLKNEMSNLNLLS